MERKTAHLIEEKERTEDISTKEDVTFSEMYLQDIVLKGLHSAGFVRPSPIQLNAIPLGRCGLDLIVQAKSGTGKTCVFIVIALEMISVIAKTTQVLIVAPTREIAVQITQVVNSIGASMVDLRASTFIGGVDLEEDKAKLQCCHIAVGTPGRLIQLMTLGLLNLSNVRLLILDEADKLLEGQFKKSIGQIVENLPHNKQVLAMSATYPEEITVYLESLMRQPSHIRLDKSTPALLGVHQYVRLLPCRTLPHQNQKAKFCEILYLLSNVSFNQCLIFSNSQLRAESICNQLENNGWPVALLSGGQCQQDRLKAFHDLCSYKCRILVSTDLSARGIDSEHVNLVINIDIPKDHATYLHRVGRAGRFGSKGTAISVACEGEETKTMKAISAAANVDLLILPEKWRPSDELNKNDEAGFYVLERLKEEECIAWMAKQKSNISYAKKDRPETKGLKTSVCHPDDKKLQVNIAKKLSISKDKNDNVSILGCKNLVELVKYSNTGTSKIPFKFCEIFERCTDQRDTVSKCDIAEIKMNSLITDESIFSKENIKDLCNFRQQKEKYTALKVPKKFDSLQALDDFMNGKDFQNHIQSSSESENGMCNSIPKANGLSSISKEKKELLLQKKELLLQLQANNIKHNSSTITSINGIKKSPVIAKSPMKPKNKIKNSNTGYGVWEPVVSKAEEKRQANHSKTYLSVKSQSSIRSSSSSTDDSLSETDFSFNTSSSYYDSSFSERSRSVSNDTNPYDFCIKSSVKFVEMMHYARAVGRMSYKLSKTCSNAPDNYIKK